MPEPLITGLDIGSSAIRAVVGKRVSSGEQTSVQLLAAVESPAEGIHRGAITSIEDAVTSISRCLEQAERIVGAPLERVWVGISGSHVLATTSRGVVGVSRPDGEIREEDVERAIEAARAIATPSNYEILHVIPKLFIVDGQTHVKDPIGMNGIRLEVEAEIIQGLSSQVKNLTKCVYRTGVEIEDLVYSILATSDVVATPRQKELGVVVVNVGSTTTAMAVFEEGTILDTAVLPIGSEHITADIAIGLRTSLDVAERVKLIHGTALPESVAKKEELNLADLGGPEPEMVSRKYVAEIIEARVEEILDKIDRELRSISRSGLLPAGVLFTGGGSKLVGFLDVAKRKLRLPAMHGGPLNISSVGEFGNDLSFTTAIGLVRWGSDASAPPGTHLGRLAARLRGVEYAAKSVRRWISSLLP